MMYMYASAEKNIYNKYIYNKGIDSLENTRGDNMFAIRTKQDSSITEELFVSTTGINGYIHENNLNTSFPIIDSTNNQYILTLPIRDIFSIKYTNSTKSIKTYPLQQFPTDTLYCVIEGFSTIKGKYKWFKAIPFKIILR